MIRFIVATFAEAKPIIDLFDLKKNHKYKEFSVYDSNEITLTVSKIGRINSALAVAYNFFGMCNQESDIWINFGLCGHKTQKIGKIFLVKKLYDNSSNKVFFPFVHDFKVNSLDCITADKKNFNYQRELFDMEASGFFESVTKFVSKEFVFILKLVSDNEKESIDFSSKEEIYNLIIKQRTFLKAFCKNLKNLAKKSSYKYQEDFKKKSNNILEKLNFTYTQKIQMKSLLKLYFLKEKKLDDNLINTSKSCEYNIRQLKKQLSL